MAAMVTIYDSTIQYIGCEIFGNTGIRHYVIDGMRRKNTNLPFEVTIEHCETFEREVYAKCASQYLADILMLGMIDKGLLGTTYMIYTVDTTANDGSANKGE